MNLITQLKSKLRNRTQADLAREIGISPAFLCAVLKGKPPGQKIRKFLGVEKRVQYVRKGNGS